MYFIEPPANAQWGKSGNDNKTCQTQNNTKYSFTKQNGAAESKYREYKNSKNSAIQCDNFDASLIFKIIA